MCVPPGGVQEQFRHASHGSRLPTESDSGLEGETVSESDEVPPNLPDCSGGAYPPDGSGSGYPPLQSPREVNDSNRSLSARNLLQQGGSARSLQLQGGSIRDTAGSLVTAGV